jgi:hypothetical protein
VVVWLGSAQSPPLLPPFGPAIRQYLDGILAYFDTKLTSGAIEAVNGIIQQNEWLGDLETSSTSEPQLTIELVSSICISQTC